MAGYERNTANQKLVVFVFDTTTGVAKTGDAANIRVYYKELGGAVTELTDGGAGEATELDATNAPGYYEVDIAAGEIDTAYTYFFPRSVTASTGAVAVMPSFTVPAGFSAGTGQVALATGGISSTTFTAGAINAAAIATDAIDDDALAANAVTAIQAGLSTFDHTTNQVLLTTATQDQINSIESSFTGVGIPFTTTGTPTTTSVPISGIDLGDATGDHNRQYCFFTSGAQGVLGVGRWITTFTNTGEGTGTLAFSGGATDPDAPLPVAPAAGVTGRILGRR